LRRFLIRSAIDFSDEELSAAFKRLDIDRDSRVTFTEFKRLFTAAAGSFLSTANPSHLTNNLFKSSTSNDLRNSFGGRKFDNTSTLGKQSFNRLNLKSPLKTTLASASKTRKTNPLTRSVAADNNNFHNNIYNKYRDMSPLKEKTLGILNRSIDTFSRSPYGKSVELPKSVSRAAEILQKEEINNHENDINTYTNYNKNQNKSMHDDYNENHDDNFNENLNNNIINNDPNSKIKNNNLLFSSSTFKSTNNNFNSTANTNAFSNANKLSNASNFAAASSNKDAEFNPVAAGSRYEEDNFNSYLKEMIQLENEIESAKFDLIIKADFNIENAFRIFELSGRGYLTQLDIKYGMNSLDIYPSKVEIELLVKRYDLTNEGILK